MVIDLILSATELRFPVQFLLVEHKGGIALRCCFFRIFVAAYGFAVYCVLKIVLRLQGTVAIRIKGISMTAKRTYSVRLDEDQRRQLEERSDGIGLPVGHLIRGAITDFLRQQDEKDYLSEVEMRIATAINRLGRQVEKDRAEQQLVVGILDGLREWLAFTLPTPPDKAAAHMLMAERNKVFLAQLPLLFVSQSKAKVTAYMEANDRLAEPCPKCGTGRLKCKQGKKRPFWYCTNWNATPKCDATFSDDGGQPLLLVGNADGD